MRKSNKVFIFLGISAFIVLLITIFAVGRFRNPISNEYSRIQYEENIRLLNDTIRDLKVTISKYESEIERIELEREKIRKELDLILKSNEETDNDIINGSFDYNIDFLTKYLSEQSSDREGHTGGDNGKSVEDNQ